MSHIWSELLFSTYDRDATSTIRLWSAEIGTWVLFTIRRSHLCSAKLLTGTKPAAVAEIRHPQKILVPVDSDPNGGDGKGTIGSDYVTSNRYF